MGGGRYFLGGGTRLSKERYFWGQIFFFFFFWEMQFFALCGKEKLTSFPTKRSSVIIRTLIERTG